MQFGEHFKKARKQSRRSQKQVADELGIHQSNISDWENDVSRPSLEYLIALANLYEVTLYELLGLDDPFFPTK